MYKKLNNIEKMLFIATAISMGVIYIYSAIISPLDTQYHRGVYVLCTYIMAILLYPSSYKAGKAVDYTLISLSIIACGYYIINYEALIYRAGIENSIDGYISIIGMLVGIEIARRVIGNVFVFIGVIFLAYGIFGPYFPAPFSHPGSTFTEMSITIFLKDEGVFGVVTNAIATYILLFIIFGTFLEKSGAHRFFINFPLALFGHKVGGAAKVSVVSSALFGSISGSAIANTVTTGAFTIPLMKKSGFNPPHSRGC